jgi:hypothetical protein
MVGELLLSILLLLVVIVVVSSAQCDLDYDVVRACNSIFDFIFLLSTDEPSA